MTYACTSQLFVLTFVITLASLADAQTFLVLYNSANAAEGPHNSPVPAL
jgi:hypothetical protein